MRIVARDNLGFRMPAAKTVKKAVNLSISADLLLAARNRGINLSAALESAVAQQLRELGRRQWLNENARGLQAYNHDVEKYGTFRDDMRTP